MPYTKIWIHAVWATYKRQPLLDSSIRPIVFKHIQVNAQKNDIYLDFINGYVDHVHCLISLRPDQCTAEVIKMIKGESSFWINKQKLINTKFKWQSEYYAVSISESQIHQVRKYIQNQEIHHQKKSFTDECNEIVMRYRFERHKLPKM